jgi:hypothetical protein
MISVAGNTKLLMAWTRKTNVMKIMPLVKSVKMWNELLMITQNERPTVMKWQRKVGASWRPVRMFSVNWEVND